MEDVKLHKEKMRLTLQRDCLVDGQIGPGLLGSHRGAVLKAMEKEDKSEVTQICR